MPQAHDLDELQRQYEALGFTEALVIPQAANSVDASPLIQDAALQNTETEQDVENANEDIGIVPPAAAERASDLYHTAADGQVITLSDLHQQFENIFGSDEAVPSPPKPHRPTPLDLGDQSGPASADTAQASNHTPQSSATSEGTAALAIGGIDEFAMYQRFRLHMVKIFGSVASALFEMGADLETGKLSRESFVKVLSDRLRCFSRPEANSLFSHATNADVMDFGIGGEATFRDFSISEDEWRAVVSAKTTGTGHAMPFQSTPGGTSMGIYHRNINLDQALADSARSPSKYQVAENTQEANTTASTKASVSMATPGTSNRKMPQHRRRRKVLNGNGERVWPWQLQQKGWTPSTLAGQGFLKQAATQVTTCRSRINEYAFKSALESPLSTTMISVLGMPERHECLMDLAAGHSVTSCPPNRDEMQPKASVRQVAEWWPYSRPQSRPGRMQLAKQACGLPELSKKLR